MKNLFKVGLLLVAVTALFTATVSQAQIPTTGVNVISSGSITNAAQSATNVAWVIDCSKQANVAITFRVMFGESGTTNSCNAFITRSLDGTYYADTGQLIAIPQAQAGSASTVITNIPSQGAQFLKVSYLTNNAATANITNIYASYLTKISAP